jgi:aryl-phospho-beta-D-glucosidase BglC (GH1 family)
MSGSITNTTTATGGMNLIGVNIAGGEFGSKVPGVLGTDYIYPSTQEIDYYASQGMTAIRVPFLIERLENSPNGAFSQHDLQQLQSIVAYAATKGIDVILDPHNYGYAWGQEILPGNTTEREYDTFMSRFAAAFKSDHNVIFGLMNQPHQQTPTQQAHINNDAIAAIRGVGATQELLVPGTDWDGGWTWLSSGNAAAINPSTIVDPDHNYAIEVHQYLDSDGSGTHFSPITDPNIGPERLTAVTHWAEGNGVKLFLGETGVPSDSQSLTALQNELGYMEQNSSVWQGVAYWAGGAWWGNYPMSIEPTGLGTGTVTNAPQMNILKQFAPGGDPVTGDVPVSQEIGVSTPGSGSITDASGDPSLGAGLGTSISPLPDPFTMNGGAVNLNNANETLQLGGSDDQINLNGNGTVTLSQVPGSYPNITIDVNVPGATVDSNTAGGLVDNNISLAPNNSLMLTGNLPSTGGLNVSGDGTLINNGEISASMASIDSNVLGTGSMTFTSVHDGPGNSEISGSVGAGITVNIAGSTPESSSLTVENPDTFQANVTMTDDSFLDLIGLSATSYDFKNDLLTLYDGNQVVYQLHLTDQSTDEPIYVTSDTGGVTVGIWSPFFGPPPDNTLPQHTATV